MRCQKHPGSWIGLNGPGYCQTCAREREASRQADATACSRIVGYRLQDGTDKAEIHFLPGRPSQKTLNQLAELLKCGWLVTGIIYSENVKDHSPIGAVGASNPESDSAAPNG